MNGARKNERNKRFYRLSPDGVALTAQLAARMALHQRIPGLTPMKAPAMDLLDRYLAAIGALLPGRQRADITDELRDVLMNRAEDKEATAARPAPDPARRSADLLRAFGHPLAVAGRYSRQQYLVGPELYPLYEIGVKILLAAVAIVALITGVASEAVTPGQPGAAIGAAIGVAIRGVLTGVGALTIVAFLLQAGKVAPKFLTEWDPNDLPRPMRRPLIRPQTRFHHVAGIIVQVIFILWWIHLLPALVPYINYIPLKLGEQLVLSRAPIWDTLFWPVLFLAAGAIGDPRPEAVGWAEALPVRRLRRGYGLPGRRPWWGGPLFALGAGHWMTVVSSCSGASPPHSWSASTSA